MMRAEHATSRVVAGSVVVALHALAIVGLLAIQPLQRVLESAPAVEAFLLFDSTSTTDEPDAAAPPDPAPLPVAEVASEPVESTPSLVAEPEFAAESADGAITVATQSSGPSTASVQLPPTVDAVDYVVAPAPRYPAVSRRLREEGTVWLRVLVDADGRPAEVSILQSSGSSRLDEAAVRALLEATFRPHAIDGHPAAAYVRVPVEFSLRRA